jgi:hypothetical protein
VADYANVIGPGFPEQRSDAAARVLLIRGTLHHLI